MSYKELAKDMAKAINTITGGYNLHGEQPPCSVDQLDSLLNQAKRVMDSYYQYELEEFIKNQGKQGELDV